MKSKGILIWTKLFFLLKNKISFLNDSQKIVPDAKIECVYRSLLNPITPSAHGWAVLRVKTSARNN